MIQGLDDVKRRERMQGMGRKAVAVCCSIQIMRIFRTFFQGKSEEKDKKKAQCDWQDVAQETEPCILRRSCTCLLLGRREACSLQRKPVLSSSSARPFTSWPSSKFLVVRDPSWVMSHDGYPGLLGSKFAIFINFCDQNLTEWLHGRVKRCGRAEPTNFLMTSIYFFLIFPEVYWAGKGSVAIDLLCRIVRSVNSRWLTLEIEHIWTFGKPEFGCKWVWCHAPVLSRWYKQSRSYIKVYRLDTSYIWLHIRVYIYIIYIYTQFLYIWVAYEFDLCGILV